jgi:orotidine-5'-phosphate decarboxylase
MSTQAFSPLIVALDFPTEQEALQMVDQLPVEQLFVKVGMQLFYAAGPSLIEQLRKRGIHVFVDLKLHDIPNTVKGAAQSLTRLGVNLMTVHCAGGRAMLEAAKEGVEQAAGSEKPLIVGVTQLTSTTQSMLNDELGLSGSVEQAVLQYATLASQAGLDGVVCSAKEVPSIKESFGSSFVTVTPGIRPAGSTSHDQARVATPVEAVRLGSDFLVVGRALTQAFDPRAVYEQLLADILQEKSIHRG